MANPESFERYARRYDDWFESNRSVYQAELRAVRSLLPSCGMGIEIGVGTGRFAAPLGVRFGVEPSPAMARFARQRGIHVVRAVAKALPFMDASFDFALMITTLCFLDDVNVSLQETHRVLRGAGSLIIGFIDSQSHLGKMYRQRKATSPFYREARFYSVPEVISFMENAGFGGLTAVQTICGDSHERNSEPIRPGFGEGSFVVLRGTK